MVLLVSYAVHIDVADDENEGLEKQQQLERVLKDNRKKYREIRG